MPKTRPSNPFLKMQHLDLAYAVQRLVRLGTTTAEQVGALAAERHSAIVLLESKVAALKAALDVDGPQATRKYRSHAKKPVTKTPAKVAERKVGRPKGAKSKPRIVKASQRAGKVSATVIAARKRQGKYMGIRRHLSASLQAEATRIAQAQGIAAALKFVEANRAKSAA
jgi:hypothetical protein